MLNSWRTWLKTNINVKNIYSRKLYVSNADFAGSSSLQKYTFFVSSPTAKAFLSGHNHLRNTSSLNIVVYRNSNFLREVMKIEIFSLEG